MYLKKLHLSNFRKYKSLVVDFKNGLNVLIGENDSGKTGIVDAIRYLLNTKSFETIKFDPKDFYREKDSTVRADSFELVGIFDGFNDSEAANFLEWGSFNADKKFELRLLLKVNLQNNNRITWDLKAGPESAETQMDGNARELLKVTYLKPLRDAESELTPGYRSRLAQILQSHKSFHKKKDVNGQIIEHPLEKIIKKANENISKYLDGVKANDQKKSENILNQINEYIEGFKHKDDPRLASLKIADPELNKILRSLGLELEENSPGLGTLNKLFMAAELLHLETDPYNSIRLCLIEELEAHLHPQAQLRVINTLKNVSSKQNTQFILTTHSTTLGASIDLQDLILCIDDGVYPMGESKTLLAKGDYKFLQRFLDSTKANLFFAKGVIMVEGDAENILVPTIADLIGLPLHEYGVSIVNVGSTAFLRYANIFMRKDEDILNIPVAVITDLDVRAMEYYSEKENDIPAYHKVQDQKLIAFGSNFDLSEIHENLYLNEKDFKNAIKEQIKKNQLDFNRMPNGVNEIIEKWPKEKLSLRTIDSIRNARRKTIKSKFDKPVKAFLNEKWTLEYDIALSENLREYFAQAVEVAKRISSSEFYFNELYDEEGNFNLPNTKNSDDGDKSIEDLVREMCSQNSKFEVAYNIFKPFVSNNKPSKAVTAQIFSEILLKNREKLSEIIKSDTHLKYIVDAIRYTCVTGDSDGQI